MQVFVQISSSDRASPYGFRSRPSRRWSRNLRREFSGLMVDSVLLSAAAWPSPSSGTTRMEMLLEAFAVVVFCVVSVLIFRKWKTMASTGHLPPPPFLPSLPLIGSMPFIRIVNIFEFLMEKSTHLGPIFTFRAGNKYESLNNIMGSLTHALSVAYGLDWFLPNGPKS